MFKYPDLYAYYSALQHIDEGDWLAIEAISHPVSFKKGEVLFEAGQACQNVFSLRSGLVRNFYTDGNGKELVKIFLTPGQVASPYIEMVTGIVPRSSAQALSDIEGTVSDFNSLMTVLDSSSGLKKLHLAMVHFFYAVKEKREYELLMLDAKSRYLLFLTEYSEYVDQIPLAHVASYLGITPVSLSRLRRDL